MIKLNSHVGLVWVKMINVNVNVGIGQRNPKNWRPESAFPHLWQLFPCLGDLTSRCYMPRHPPQGRRGPVPRPQADSTHSTHWLWQTDDWTRFKGVIGERENRGLEKFDRKWSEEARRRDQVCGRSCLRLQDFKQLCVSQPEVYSDSPYHILRNTL